MSDNKKLFYAFLILVTAFFILRLPTLFELPWIDQALFAYMGQKIWNGQVIYRDLWDHKPPGIFFFYGWISSWGKGSPWVIPLTDTLYTLLTMGALLLLGKSFWGLKPALGAAFIFILFSISPIYQGAWSRNQAEILINLPMILFFYGAWQGVRQQKSWLWFFSGLALGIAFIIKFTALLLALPLIPLLGAPAPPVAPAKNFRFKSLSYLVLGGALPLVAVILYLHLKSVLPHAYNALVVYNGVYSTLRMENKFLLAFVAQQLKGQMLFTVAVFFLILMGIWQEKLYRTNAGRILLLWVLGGLFSFYLQGKFFWYHFLSLVPPLSLLAGFAIGLARMEKKSRPSLWFSWSMVILVVMATADIAGAYLRHYRPGFAILYQKTDYAQMLRSLPANTNKLELWEWGKFIARNSQDKDYVYVWGFAPEIYYYSGRSAPNRFIHHFYLLDAQNPLAKKFPGLKERQQELLTELKEKPVKFFIVDLTSTNLLAPATPFNQLINFSELNLLVKNNYTPLAQSDRFLILQRKRNENEN